MVKGLSRSLLRQYKKAWETKVAIKYKIASAKRTERPSRVERHEIALDIKKTLFGLVGKRSVSQINESVDYLYGWCLLEVGPKDILRTLHSIHWLLEPPTITIIVRRLDEFFMGFTGPGFVRMTAGDERQVIEAVKLLGVIGIQAVILEADLPLFVGLAHSFNRFAQIGLDYRRKAIGRATIGEINAIRSQSKESLSPKRINEGIKRLDSAIKTAKAALKPGRRRVGFEVLLKKRTPI
jgi:hypothetical protein